MKKAERAMPILPLPLSNLHSVAVGHSRAENHEPYLYSEILLRSMLIELIQEGVIVISHNLQPVYLNLKAREICQQLWNGNHHSDRLPPVISDLYHRLIRNLSSEDRVFVMDCQVAGERTIRIRARCLNLEFDDELNGASGNRPWLLVFLEDRGATLQEELQIEQKKYDLTDRETQILNLLLKAYTYQQIAKMLQISLNTVKFHVKNIYAKKRTQLEHKTYFEIFSDRENYPNL